MKCFFCEEQNVKKIGENEQFFSRYDDFPINKGHALIAPKQHIKSFFELSTEQVQEFYELLKQTKEGIQDKFKPDGFNIGINEGEAAGQTCFHLHIHIIPRYKGDVENPKSGVRNIIPKKASYVEEAKKIESKKDYL